MYEIAILDDNQVYIKHAKKLILQYLGNNNQRHSVVEFKNSEELIGELKNNQRIGVVFLDIELDGEVGIDVAKQINGIRPELQIVFLTNYLHYATDIFETQHCYFVLKDEFEQRLPDVFRKIELHKTDDVLTVKHEGKNYVLKQKDIQYIERKLRKTLLHCEQEDVLIVDKISELYPRLNQNFFLRCHNSYIVNLNCVQSYERQRILMKDQTEIPISRSYYNQVKENILHWAKNYL